MFRGLSGNGGLYLRDRGNPLVHAFQATVSAFEDEPLSRGVNASFSRTPGALCVTKLERSSLYLCPC